MDVCWDHIEERMDHLSVRVLDFPDNQLIESLYDDVFKLYKRLYEIKKDKDCIIERQTNLLREKRAELVCMKNVLFENGSTIGWYINVIDSIEKKMDNLENLNEYGWLYVKYLFDYFYFVRTIADCLDVPLFPCHDVMDNLLISKEMFFTYPFWVYFTRLHESITKLVARIKLHEELDLVRGFEQDLNL